MGNGRKEPRSGWEASCAEVEMRFALVVLVALGLTMAWQAAVVADNNQQETALNITADPASPAGEVQSQRD